MRLLLIAHDIRSTYNVGAIARSADGLGAEKVYCTGFTPYLIADNDERPPFVKTKLKHELHKTALGAEETMGLHHEADVSRLIARLKHDGFLILALEQTPTSRSIINYPFSEKVALLLGSEPSGLSPEILELADAAVEIPMIGQKESFNVSVAAGIALYEAARNHLYLDKSDANTRA